MAYSALSTAVTGFNYLYRRTATASMTAPTPQSVTSSLPPAQTKTPTPALGAPSLVQSNGASPNVEAVPAPFANQTHPQSESTSSPKTNGAPTATDPAKEKQQIKKQQKKEREKERKKEEKERERAEKDAGSKDGSKDGSERKEASPHQAKPSTSSTVPSQDADPLSPAESGAGSAGGTRTPTGPPRRRNPWTLFMKLPGPCNETEIREFFLSSKDGVCRFRCVEEFLLTALPIKDHGRQIPSE